MAKTLCVISGGMDSATLLYLAAKEEGDVEAVSFNYGQRHQKELVLSLIHISEPTRPY